jgi:hypothetical protein
MLAIKKQAAKSNFTNAFSEPVRKHHGSAATPESANEAL